MSNEEGNILNSMNDKELDKLLKEISGLKVPSSPKGKEKAWSDILSVVDKTEQKEAKVIRFSTTTAWYSIAASIIVLLVIGWLVQQNSMVKIVVPKGEFASIVLPDKSEVKINADSKVEYKRFGWLKRRQIILRGEAYFAVNNGNQFTVDAGNGQKVTVTGTEFDVYARDLKFEVKCFDGAVIVETPRLKPVTITKGNGISIKKDTIESKPFIIDSTATSTWINGEFYFTNAQLNEVLDEVQRQFNVSISTDGFDPTTKHYTGYFKNEKLKDALDIICLPMGLVYTITPDSTFVTIKIQ